MYKSSGLLVLPRLRIQNANAISSPLTWGFPSVTAFVGFMWALERKLSGEYQKCSEIWYSSQNEPRQQHLPLIFRGIGVVCHSFEAQVSGDYQKVFHLTRNPLDKAGSTNSIAQEGRAHLDVTMLLGVDGAAVSKDEDSRIRVARVIEQAVQSMRIAGGTIVPTLSHSQKHYPALIQLGDLQDQKSAVRRQLRRCLPGSALVLREDVLQSEFAQMLQHNSNSSLIHAWLHLSRLNMRAEKVKSGKEVNEDDNKKAEWKRVGPPGWLVPIPIGYRALGRLNAAGAVRNARDIKSEFRFVESIYSIGEWVGIHKIKSVEQLLWYTDGLEKNGEFYRCKNDFVQSIGEEFMGRN